MFGMKDVARLESGNILHTEHLVSASAFQSTGRQQLGRIIPHAVKHSLALLRMAKKSPETLLNLVGLLQ